MLNTSFLLINVVILFCSMLMPLLWIFYVFMPTCVAYLYWLQFLLTFTRSHVSGRVRLRACLTSRGCWIIRHGPSVSVPTRRVTICHIRPPTRGTTTLITRQMLGRQQATTSLHQYQLRRQNPPGNSSYLAELAVPASNARSVFVTAVMNCWVAYSFPRPTYTVRHNYRTPWRQMAKTLLLCCFSA